MRREYNITPEEYDLLFYAPFMTDLNETVNNLPYTVGSRATYSFGNDGMTFTTTGNYTNGGYIPLYTANSAFRTLMSNYTEFVMQCDIRMTVNNNNTVFYARGNNNKYCPMMLYYQNVLPLNKDVRLVTYYTWNKTSNQGITSRYAYCDDTEYVLQQTSSHSLSNLCNPAQINQIWICCNSSGGSSNLTESGVVRDIIIYGKKPTT